MKRIALFAACVLLVPAVTLAQRPVQPAAQKPAAVPGLSAERLERIAPAMNQLLKDGKKTLAYQAITEK